MNTTMNQTERYLDQLKKGRGNLLLMAGLTLVNILLYFMDVGTNFPFSAFVPQAAVMFGMDMQLYYGVSEFIVFGIAFAALSVIFYAVCGLLSVKRPGWLIAALIAFGLDTAALLFFVFVEFDAAMLIDIAFHAWVLYYLIRAGIARAKLRLLLDQPVPVESAEPALEQPEQV